MQSMQQSLYVPPLSIADLKCRVEQAPKVFFENSKNVEFTFSGWVSAIPGASFVHITDGSGETLQVVVNKSILSKFKSTALKVSPPAENDKDIKDKDVKNSAPKTTQTTLTTIETTSRCTLSRCAAVRVEGKIVECAPDKKQLFELVANKFEILCGVEELATFLPAQKGVTLDTLRAHHDVRTLHPGFRAIMKIQSTVNTLLHEFMQKRGVTYMQPNILTVAMCEGGAEVFQATTLIRSGKLSDIPTMKTTAKKEMELASVRLRQFEQSKDEMTKRIQDLSQVVQQARSASKRGQDADKKDKKADDNADDNSDTILEKQLKNMKLEADKLSKTIAQLKDGFIASVRKYEAADANQIDFSQDFAGRPIFLTESSQMPLEFFCRGIYGGVYTTNKSFRAEKSKTRRHLGEFEHDEWELHFKSIDELMDFSEDVTKYIFDGVLKRCQVELSHLESTIPESKGAIAKLKGFLANRYARVSYIDALKILQEHKNSLLAYSTDIKEVPKFGDDFGSYVERWLCEVHFKNTPVFLHGMPRALKSFYMRPNPPTTLVDADGKSQIVQTCQAVDLLFPGMGELIGSSMRDSSYESLVAEMKSRGMKDAAELEAYCALRKSAYIPTGGAGMGRSRLVTLCVSGMGGFSIHDVVPAPVSYQSPSTL